MTRKFLRNTTSVALCIGVALPQIAAAQPMNDGRIILAAADEVAQAGDAVILVPPPEEQAEPEAESAAEPEPEAETEPVPEPEAEPEAEAAPEPEAAPTEEPAAAAAAVEPSVAETAEPAPEPAPEPAAEAAPQPVPEPAAEPAPEPEAAAQSEPATLPAPEADPDAEALARALAEQEEAATADADTTTEAAATDAEETSPQPPVAATAEPQDADATDTTAASPDDAAMAGTDAGEAPETSADAESGTTDATTATTPDAASDAADGTDGTDGTDAAADTTSTTAPTTEATDATTEAPAEALPSTEDLEAALAEVVEVPEAEAPTTDAAREAAAADTAPEAAALDDAPPVTTTEAQTLTEETSRSATEDFLTDLSGIISDSGVATTTGAAATAAATQDDDDRSGLEKTLRQAVLPALAGLVVGQMLSNNRQVSLNTGDRVVVTRPDGSQEIIKDDNALLLRPGSTVQTQEYADGSTRTIVTRDDGSQVVTIRDANLRVLRRSLVRADGTTVELLDDTVAVQPVDVAALPPPARPVILAPGQQMSEEALREALRRETQVNRSFTLGQIRNIPEVRALVAPVDIQAITFDTGSAAIKSDQAQALSALGRVIADSIRQNPREIYLIEGHTDTVGADAMNLALSDRRAESVALALTQFFGVPPENMVVQGYGEQFLKVPREGDIRENRRASVRRITDLLARD